MAERSQGMKVGLIGAGKMGEALVQGFLRSKLVDVDDLAASDVDLARLNDLKQKYGIRPISDNRALLEWAETVVVAVKPQSARGVFEALKGFPFRDRLVVSIVAGLDLKSVQTMLGGSERIARVMPNTPAQVMQGMSVLAFGRGASREDRSWVVRMFEAVGRVMVAPDEKMMDVATALVGSGPAFVFVFIEALADGAVRMGFQRDQAYFAAAQMVLGAAAMLKETGLHPAQLKDQVTSPAGTTIEGLKALERGGFRGLVFEAIEAATRRSRELAGHRKAGRRGGKRKAAR